MTNMPKSCSTSICTTSSSPIIFRSPTSTTWPSASNAEFRISMIFGGLHGQEIVRYGRESRNLFLDPCDVGERPNVFVWLDAPLGDGDRVASCDVARDFKVV